MVQVLSTTMLYKGLAIMQEVIRMVHHSIHRGAMAMRTGCLTHHKTIEAHHKTIEAHHPLAHLHSTVLRGRVTSMDFLQDLLRRMWDGADRDGSVNLKIPREEGRHHQGGPHLEVRGLK